LADIQSGGVAEVGENPGWLGRGFASGRSGVIGRRQRPLPIAKAARMGRIIRGPARPNPKYLHQVDPCRDANQDWI
jgi:hypothetical protein